MTTGKVHFYLSAWGRYERDTRTPCGRNANEVTTTETMGAVTCRTCQVAVQYLRKAREGVHGGKARE